MNKLLNILITVPLIININCNNKKVEKLELDEKMKSIVASNVAQGENLSADFCRILFEYKWDSILVLHPYFSKDLLYSIDIKNKSSLSMDIGLSNTSDNTCTLLFIKDSKLTYYSIIRRHPIDFTTLAPLMPGKIPAIHRRDCIDLFIERKVDVSDPNYIYHSINRKKKGDL